MNPSFTYFLILAISLAGPFFLSFDKKVHFYKKWKYAFPAILLPALLYAAWDMYFTKLGIWYFNTPYISGLHVGNLPLEEALFFLVVPYCCLFVYECIRCYFPNLKDSIAADRILILISSVVFIAGVVNYDKYYTSWTFVGLGVFVLFFFISRKYWKGFDTLSFLVSFAIILVPFFIVNGYLTSIPVVLYNDQENLGFRLFTIPFEDTFYGMLLMLMNVLIFERKRSGSADEVSRAE